MAIFSVCLILISAFAAYSIYCTETLPAHLPRNAYSNPISGFLIYIMISLVFVPIKTISALVSEKYLSIHTWNTYETGAMSSCYRTLLVFETFGNVVMLCFSIFCLILMYRRRDILPKVIIGFYSFVMLFYFTDFVYGKYVTQTGSDDDIANVIVAVLIGAICTRFFKTSYLVEDTFTVPYPAKASKRSARD